MELLRYEKMNEKGAAYIIQVSSTDITQSWDKFKVRAQELAPERYCSYSMCPGGKLLVYNCDTGREEQVEESEWAQARPIFFEDHRYNISLSFFDAADRPRIIHQNKEVEALFSDVQTAADAWVLNCNIDFLNQPGHFALDFAYTDKRGQHVQDTLAFDVLSPKLDTKKDLNLIIQEIRNEYGDLVFRYLTLTFQQFEMGREVNNELIWLSVFKKIVDDYLSAVRFVLNRPHNKMRLYDEYQRPDRIKRWTNSLAERFTSDRMRDESRALRTYYRTEQAESTEDTRENRFVKYTLGYITTRLSKLMRKLGEGTSESEKDILNDRLSQLESLRRNSFFKGIGLFDGLRQQSMVLQQRSGYAQVYRSWIMLQSGLDLIQGETSVGVQPIWKLYELWCFLKVKNMVCNILGIDPRNKEHILKYIEEHTKNDFDLFEGGFLGGNVTYTNPQNGDKVEVGYQYSISRKSTTEENPMRSVTVEQKPDIVMHIHKAEQDITLTYLYDAKYRVNGEDDATVKSPIDEPVPSTLDAMHHYRDAIYYGNKGEQRFSKEVIGGYILFPGRLDERKTLEDMKSDKGRLPYYLRSIQEVNIGAFPLLPNSESGLLLEDHLRTVLLDETVTEQLKDSVPQRGLYYHTVPMSEQVIVVMANENGISERAAYAESLAQVDAAKKYAIGLGSTPGALSLAEGFTTARYLLLHNKITYQLYKLKDGPQLTTSDDIQKNSIPHKMKEASIFMVFNIEENITEIFDQNVSMKKVVSGRHGYESRTMEMSYIIEDDKKDER